MNSLIFQYSSLQVLDLLTTVAFLINGVKEANPLAIALGVYCRRIPKYR